MVEAQMSRGRLQSRMGKWTEARLSYDVALEMAQDIESRRLEAALRCNLARLALEQGDCGGSRDQALQSLKIANELRLGLRVSYSLVVLGLASLSEGHRGLGIAYLKQAKRLANQQQYWYRAREAEVKLQELGENDESFLVPAVGTLVGEPDLD